jgi:transcriptional regulator with XRE-family HTH domain
VTFGETLKQVRTELGWTQPQLAHEVYEATDGQIDLTPAEISRYERGRVKSPRLDVVRAVAKATGRPVEFFANSTPREAAPTGDPFREVRRGPAADVSGGAGASEGAAEGDGGVTGEAA